MKRGYKEFQPSALVIIADNKIYIYGKEEHDHKKPKSRTFIELLKLWLINHLELNCSCVNFCTSQKLYIEIFYSNVINTAIAVCPLELFI